MRHTVQITLPEEIAALLETEDPSAKAKEALVMDLLREHKISQGKAAELLDLTRYELFDLMAKHNVAAFDYREGALAREVRAAKALAKRVKGRKKTK